MDINKEFDKQPDEPSKHNITIFRKGTFLYKLRHHFRSYCNHTSIHGFQYFGQERTVLEKCWWVVVFIGIISCCGFTIYLIYTKWRQSPVIVSLTTRDTPIYQVPFPAVTICPTIKFHKEYINFGDLFDRVFDDDDSTSLSENEKKLFQYILPLCKAGLMTDYQDFLELQNMSTLSTDIYESFHKHSPFMDLGGNSATFMESDMEFNEDFHPFLTEDGLCFTFNMLSTNDIFRKDVYVHPAFNSSGPRSFWIPQHGYSHEAGLDTYPRRALLSGAINSLEIKLFHLKKDIDYKCTGAEQGYKVILHMPTRVPRPALEYTMVPFSKSSMISVKPSMMMTSQVVKSYAADKRDCYFQDERELKFFKIYSQANCAQECLTNYTLKECKCVAFYMPRESDTAICGISKLECVNNARKKYNLAKLRSKLSEQPQLKSTRLSMWKKTIIPPKTANNMGEATMKKLHKKRRSAPIEEDLNDDEARCNCLRSCNDITYYGTATAMDYDWREESYLGSLMNSTEYDFTMITIFLDTNTIFTTERNELYGPTDFLSNFGGLLGLFTGFSILSLMEILYFCTLRILGNRRLIGRWYGDRDED